MIKVLVGVCAMETMRTRTAFSLLNLRNPNGETLIQIGCEVAHSRNTIADIALDKGCSHVLFIDSDMLFKKDTLERMLAHDKDILGVAYNKRKIPLQSVVSPLDTVRVGGVIPTELFMAHSTGTGMLIIKTEVFTNMSYPYFKYDYSGERWVGEDVYFCEKAQEAGYKIWVDPTIPVKHLGEYEY